MSTEAAEWIEQKNRFSEAEAEQERRAYEAEMRQEMAENPSLASTVDGDDAPPSGEPDSSRDEAPPESGPKPIMVSQMAQPALPQIQGGVVLQKQHHGKLVLEGVCTHCAHCGQPLSDAESVERGIGPVCSKKGYFEEPKDSDDIQALIDLAEYPELVEFLTKNYKPQGVRGLVNGLVRVCSLNRKTEVHQACTDAVESLGYKMLASLLRESLCVIEIKEIPTTSGNPDYSVWVKKAEWKPSWSWDLRGIPGAFLSRKDRGWIVQHQFKRQLWDLVLKHYEGFFLKTKDGAVRIRYPKKK